MWFTESVNGTANNIARITTAGLITTYAVPTANSEPAGITAGPDGALWFTEYNGNKVGRITTAGTITEYPVPVPLNAPYGITAGPDGALWFTLYNGDKIGRITTAGVITEYFLSTSANTRPFWIAPGPDGALWFTEQSSNQIGRITTAGVITQYSIPTPKSTPEGIAAGPYGLWFGQTGKIGEVVLTDAVLTLSPASASYQTNLTFTGSGFAPGEGVRIYLEGVGSPTLAVAAADSGGSFTAPARAPQSPFGPRLFLAQGSSSGKVAAASLYVTPRLIMSPNSGALGSTAAAAGYGFGPEEKVAIYWNNPRTLLGTAITDIYGTFNGSAALSFTVPLGAPSGTNIVFGVGYHDRARGSGLFNVQ